MVRGGGKLKDMMRCCAAVLVLGLVVGVIAAKDPESQILFIAENDFGKVWANLSLTRQRDAEPYIPIVVSVLNKSRETVKLTRDTIWLNDLDGLVYSMPTVKELRKNYDRSGLDHRMVSTSGIPWEGWRRSGRLAPSNFFPDLRMTSGNTVKDRVILRENYAMVDLLYFERPRALVLYKPFILEVHPEGWEVPIRLRLFIS